ncbi:MAG: VanZ family protein [Methylomonas sp.]|jgi:VanZ family protein
MRNSLDVLVLILYCGLIFWLSDQSVLPTPKLFENEDKLHHFAAYGVMGVCAWRTFRHLPLSRRLIFWLSFGYCSLYGVSDEWHQSFVIGRNSSAYDWLADAIGGFLGCWAYHARAKQFIKN